MKTIVLSACAALSGCAEAPPDIQWEGEHVRFGADHPEQVCGGTREYLDRRTGELLDALGGDPIKIDYYFVDDVDPFCSHDDVAEGCSAPGVVYSQSVPHLHEIVHARSEDRMPLVLEEGLATHLGDPYPIREMAPRERLVELLTGDVDDIATSAEYGRAAHFMAFLSETFGWQTILDLDAALSHASSAAQLDAALEAILGKGTDAVLADYESYPDCSGTVDTSIACSYPAVVSLDFLNPTYERVVDCASPDGIGPHLGMVFAEDVIELAPSVDGSRLVSGLGDGIENGGFVLLRRCGPCSENGVGKVASTGWVSVSEQDLPAGRYLVRFYLPSEASPGVVGIRISG